MIVHHVIPAERMTRAYHRMWHTREGEIRARVRYWAIVRSDGRVLPAPLDGPTWFGVPRFVYRQLGAALLRWIRAVATLNGPQAFHAECEVRQMISYIRSRRRLQRERDRLFATMRFHPTPSARRIVPIALRGVPRLRAVR